MSDWIGGELYCDACTELQTDDGFVKRFDHCLTPIAEWGTVNIDFVIDYK